jgi:hypothetical protein
MLHDDDAGALRYLLDELVLRARRVNVILGGHKHKVDVGVLRGEPEISVASLRVSGHEEPILERRVIVVLRVRKSAAIQRQSGAISKPIS